MPRKATGSISKTRNGKWQVTIASHNVGIFDTKQEAKHWQSISRDAYTRLGRFVSVFAVGLRPRRIFIDPERSDDNLVIVTNAKGDPRIPFKFLENVSQDDPYA